MSNMMHEEHVSAFSSPMKNAQPARWQRKRALQDSKGSQAREDRFIPHRSAMDFDGSNFELTKENPEAAEGTPETTAYNKVLSQHVAAPASKVLAFKAKPAPAKWDGQSELNVLYSASRASGPAMRTKKTFRHISNTPERILDAPELMDDYYLNLIDWSANNLLAVALGPAVYLWNAATGGIETLCEIEDEEDYVCSVNWTADGNYLAVGTASSTVQIWDVERQKQLRSMHGHEARVSSLAWNNHMLASGSKDGNIYNHDVRIQDHKVATMSNHSQEVCGLKWSPDGGQLASGGNDNLVNIWQPVGGGNIQPTWEFNQHQAAVKALAWCPHEAHTLATGGGTADRCIKFWNTQTGHCANSIDTKSQVCSLVWNPHDKEIVSSHGFSQNQLCVWKYPTMQKMAELTGHSSRVLHMAVSPDGETVVSGAADETLRFWKIFEKGKTKTSSGRAGAASKKMTSSLSSIR